MIDDDREVNKQKPTAGRTGGTTKAAGRPGRQQLTGRQGQGTHSVANDMVEGGAGMAALVSVMA